jgi:WXG100 family type VII secretion target
LLAEIESEDAPNPKGGKQMAAQGQIRITPEQMRGRAKEVHVQRDTFEGVISKMTNVINELQTEWEGQASRSFYDQFERLRPAFNDMRQLIYDIGTQLDGSANAVEQLDRDIASRFK